MNGWLRPVSLVVVAGALSAVLYEAHALPSSRAISLGIVLLAAIAFTELFRAVRFADEPGARAARRFEEALRPRQVRHRRPAELERMEREIVVGAAAAVWARHRLLPRLRAAAAARLSVRHGIDLDRDPQAARDLLGEETWGLLHLPKPADSAAPGISLQQVDTLLTRLESL